MTAPDFAPCESHQSLLTVDPFSRALQIAQECGYCYIGEACS